MSHTVAIHQPQYLPWVPYMAKMIAVDTFVFLDDTQFQKNGVQNRNQIRTASGPVWLTVPVRHASDATIADTPLAQPGWAEKHLRTLHQAYARAPYRDAVLDGLAPVLRQPWTTLGALNVAVCRWMLGWMGAKTALVCSSETPSVLRRQDRVVELCRLHGATRYVSGRGALAYQTPDGFARHGVELVYMNYHPQPWPQHHKGAFVPDLSAIDLFMNCGPEGSLAHIRDGLRPPSTAEEVHLP